MTRIKYVGCMVSGCLGKHRSRGFCRKHYRQLVGEGKRRYQIVKNSPEKLAKTNECIKRYKTTESFRKSKATSDKKYYEKNKEKIIKYKELWNDKKRFNGLREEVLKRDCYKCVMCGEGERLVIHHRNGIGRSSLNPDNKIDNLVTLCRGCHIKIHKIT